jgi:chromosomal replication initiator protein
MVTIQTASSPTATDASGPTLPPAQALADFHHRYSQTLAQQVGERRFELWFNQAVRFDYIADDHVLRVTVPNRFVADRVHRQFAEELVQAGQAMPEIDGADRLRIAVSIEPDTLTPGNPAAQPQVAPKAKSTTTAEAPTSNKKLVRPQDPALAGPKRHDLDSFVIGSSNELAYSATRALAESDRDAAQNLIVLHGKCGLGKTHLLQGACRRYQALHPEARVLYTTGEQFTNQYITAVRQNKLDGFRKQMRQLDLLAVDDVHFFAKKMATQQEFQHSFDHIELGGARVILASNEHPKQIAAFHETLVSRMIQGLVVQIDPPDADTRHRLYERLADRRLLSIEPAALQVLIARTDTSVREIEGALTKLHALASLQQPDSPRRVIDRALVDRLHQIEQRHQPRRSVRFEDIRKQVCETLRVTADQMAGSSRRRSVVLGRAILVHLTRELIGMSYPEIALAMGKKSHSTVITADQRLQRQLQKNHPVSVPGSGCDIAVVQLVEQIKATTTGRA